MNHKIEHVLERSYTVRNLIQELGDMDPEAHVLLTCDYGDYHKTQQALPIQDITEHESDVLHESGYSQSGIAYADPDAEPDECDDEDRVGEDEETYPVVIFHSD